MPTWSKRRMCDMTCILQILWCRGPRRSRVSPGERSRPAVLDMESRIQLLHRRLGDSCGIPGPKRTEPVVIRPRCSRFPRLAGEAASRKNPGAGSYPDAPASMRRPPRATHGSSADPGADARRCESRSRLTADPVPCSSPTAGHRRLLYHGEREPASPLISRRLRTNCSCPRQRGTRPASRRNPRLCRQRTRHRHRRTAPGAALRLRSQTRGTTRLVSCLKPVVPRRPDRREGAGGAGRIPSCDVPNNRAAPIPAAPAVDDTGWATTPPLPLGTRPRSRPLRPRHACTSSRAGRLVGFTRDDRIQAIATARRPG
jgi:hypothetical protein